MVNFKLETDRQEQARADFDEGYDQAADEIMSEVKRADPALYADLVARYPWWKLKSESTR